MEITKNNVKIYTYEEAHTASLIYFDGDDLAATVWLSKYALKDSAGNIYELNPTDMHKRLSSEFARIENKYPNPMSEDEIFGLLKDFKYIIPQGSPMSGIGNDMQKVSIGNCFVVGNPQGMGDSYGAIHRIDERISQLQKRRAGVGTDLDDIRPAGTPVNNAAITATGIVPFMERYSNTTREVAQGGRRGALMLSCSIKHPESEAFIDAKLDSTKVTGANVSVKIYDDFMEAVLSKKPYTQQWPVYSDNPVITKQVDAKLLWDKIIKNAWKSAEPGILFWDKIIDESPADCYAHQGFGTTSTNPCLTGGSMIAVHHNGVRGEIRIDNLVTMVNMGIEVNVYTFNEKTKEVELKEVEQGMLTKKNANIIELELENGETLKLTPDHKVFTDNRGWIEAAQLTEDDILLSLE